jgi:hypothetical protein
MGEKEFFHMKYKEVDVVAGDILIHKEWGEHSFGKGGIGGKIRYGQAILSHVHGGSMNSEHLAICVEGGEHPQVIEASDSFLAQRNMDLRDKLVFRAHSILADEAVFVARRLCGLDNGGGRRQLVPGHYAMSKAKKSLLKNVKLMKQGKAFLDELYDDVYAMDKSPTPKRKRCPDMFCSEFVTACYEVAARKTKMPAFGLDPRAMSPKAMEGHLKKRPLIFKEVGRAKITKDYMTWHEDDDLSQETCPFCSRKISKYSSDTGINYCDFDCPGYDD